MWQETYNKPILFLFESLNVRQDKNTLNPTADLGEYNRKKVVKKDINIHY